jgi:uncharacterized protein
MIVPDEFRAKSPVKEREFCPTAVTLLPTYDCNLRCQYCYANAGIDARCTMQPEVAFAAADLIIANAMKLGEKRISFSFHGGGEPLLQNNRSLVMSSVEYARARAKEHDLKVSVSAVTNGMIAGDYLGWIIDNFNNLNISMDGPEDVQNAQRPTAGDGGSFERVKRTIDRLEERGFKYSLRATITEKSVDRMEEILQYFAENMKGSKSYHLEPLFECGRCETTDAHAPAPGTFLERMVNTKTIAEKLGVEIYYSGGKMDSCTDRFCGACGSNFFVTPTGHVTTCLEACRPSEIGSKPFIVGEYDASKQAFVFDQGKISALQRRTIDNIPYCADCFCKYSCAGDCPAKVYAVSGDMFDPSKNARCIVNQGLLIDELSRKLKKGDV